VGVRTGGASSSSTTCCRPNCAAKCSGHQPSTVSGSFADREETAESMPASELTSPLMHAACSGLSISRWQLARGLDGPDGAHGGVKMTRISGGMRKGKQRLEVVMRRGVHCSS
jgi:hypothetical protein